jgi:hypothetical protein
MRVRSELNGYGTPTDPCNPTYYGETEDYTLTVVALPACTGTPAPGNTLSSSGSTACSGTSFTLSVQNPPAASGISYQWQSSTDGTTYANISGATSSTYTGTQTVATYYQCLVTCSGNTGTSTALNLTMNTPGNCQCIPAASTNGCSSYYINAVNATGVTSFSNSTNCTTGTYANFRNTHTVSQVQGQYVTIYVSGSNYMNHNIWVDYNDDGTFSSSESVVNTWAYYSATTGFTIPSNATVGTHAMRVRASNNYVSDPCATFSYGETEDYSLTVISSACSGVPSPGTTNSNYSSVCASNTISLSLQNQSTLSAQSGITYQWQSSTDGTTYANISGATSSTYSTTQTASTYYQCVVTCSGGSSGTSTPKQVTQNALASCYCQPTYNHYGTCYYYITNVTTTGGITNFNNPSSCSSAYQNYSSSVSASQYPGQALSFSFSSNTNMVYTVWVDYNNDAVFSSSEIVFTTSSGSTTVTGSFTIPLATSVGTHQMRVRSELSGYSTPTDPCNPTYYGETEDYTLTVVALPACTGTPAPGNTLSSSGTSVCSGVSFTLSVQNPVIASGVTYQWQSSTDGTTYTNIGGATSSTYTGSQTSAKYYKCVITCSGNSGTSTPLNLTMNAAANCQCIPPASVYNCQWYTSNVTTTSGITNFNNSTSCSTGNYSNYRSTISASQYQGSVVNMSFNGPASMYYSVWIDYNDDGTFSSSERVIATPSYGSYMSGSFTVPLTAIAGTHAMRVRSEAYYYSAPTDPCNQLYYGETEDYSFTVVVLPACSGTPAPGNTNSSLSSVCANTSFTLSLQNQSSLNNLTGITYQWQYSTNGTSYSNITGATSSTYNTTQIASTYYRCKVTCSGGSIGTSNPLQVVTNAVSCYCTPSSYNWYNCSYNLTNVTTTGGVSNINNSTSCNSYTNYSSSVIASQNQGSVVNISLSSPNPAAYSVWIDYNDNGIFSNGEKVITNNNPGSSTIVATSFTVPVGASVGTHRMRVRSDNKNNGAPSDPCNYTNDGETEDYGFTVISACNVAAPAFTSNPSTSICYGANATLVTDTIVNWYTSLTGGTSICNNSTYTTASLITGKTYYVEKTLGNGCSSTPRTSVTVNVNPFPTSIVPSTASSTGCNIMSPSNWVYLVATDNSLLAAVYDTTAGNNMGSTSASMVISATVQYFNSQPYLQREVTITPGSNGAARVRLYFLLSEFQALQAADPTLLNVSDLAVTKFTGPGLVGTEVYLQPTAYLTPAQTGMANTYAIDVNVSGFSTFVIHHGNDDLSPLPIALTDLSVTAQNNDVKVSWTTSSEINCDNFVVERSVDTETYEYVGTLKGAGNSSKVNSYTMFDKQPYKGLSYYRLVQADFDGKLSYYGPLSVNFDSKSVTANVFPNPANESVTISYQSSEGSSGTIQVFSAEGKLVYQSNLPASEKVESIRIETSEYTPGLYQARMILGNDSRSLKFIVVH